MSKLDEIIEDKNNSERIFPILNKVDRAWSVKNDMTFCELYNDIIALRPSGHKLTDLEFTKLLDEYIDKNGIK